MNLRRVFSHPLFVPSATQLILAYVWFVSGWEKVYKGTFVGGMGTVLERFEKGNPSEWYVDSILRVAKQSPVLFGAFVQWGEVLVGVGLAVSMLLLLPKKRRWTKVFARIIATSALVGAAVLNMSFYFAAGWLNASTKTLNMLMFFVQSILLMYWLFKRDSYESGITSSTR